MALTRVLLLRELNLAYQSSECLDPEIVEDYRRKLRNGEQIEPVLVLFDGADYLLYDGCHWVAGADAEGVAQIDAEIEQGTRDDPQKTWQEYLAAVRMDLADWVAKAKASPDGGKPEC